MLKYSMQWSACYRWETCACDLQLFLELVGWVFVGTVAAGLKAGRPTFVVPFFGDQSFWGAICAQRKVGPPPVPVEALKKEHLVAAISFMETHQVLHTHHGQGFACLCLTSGDASSSLLVESTMYLHVR